MTKILFAHPDEKLVALYHPKLKQYFDVHTAYDGLSALRMIRRLKPRAVISDVQLPWLSGKSLVRFVRRYPPTRQIPFIFLSHHDFDDEALGLGANDWLSLKSSHPELVIEKTYYHLRLQ